MNSALKYILAAIGIVSLALGVIGIFLPLLPTTPFLLLSAWCFLKSSPTLHAWMYRQPHIGTSLKAWDEDKIISRPAKIMALLMITFSIILLWYKVYILPVKIFVTVLLGSISIFIVTRKEKPTKKDS